MGLAFPVAVINKECPFKAICVNVVAKNSRELRLLLLSALPEELITFRGRPLLRTGLSISDEFLEFLSTSGMPSFSGVVLRPLNSFTIANGLLFGYWEIVS
jgi:hypothetical protein